MTTKQFIAKFISENRNLSIATVDKKGNPSVRVFQVMKVDEDKLYFATTTEKVVYKQIKMNSNIEVLAYADNISIRVRGEANFNLSTEVKREIFDNSEVLKSIYKSFDNEILTYFSLDLAEGEVFDLNHMPPKREFL
ncbi:MAG: pyridoxamine 5'-phosphate oxidase family protein [Bacteroidales bacterium]|jgi:uncharacterized pyridoxamine 5'-phosphate oxidase family protein|nr:pyridoxamine 5'-phosphate oxidase family protein [Bacteroidales bacterium]